MTVTQTVTQIEVIPGKWYVLDMFVEDGQPTAGPFNSREEAEKERIQLNIADDCFVAKKK